MEPVDFYALPRPAQERFIGSLDGRGLPTPILRSQPRPEGVRRALGVAAASATALLVVVTVGLGNLESGLATEGLPFLVVDVGLVALAAFAMLRGAAIHRDHVKSPFRRGLYVFPVGLFDARSPVMHVYPIEDLGEVKGPDARGVTLDFGARAFSFPERDPARVEALREALAAARTAVSEAGAARESVRPKAMAAIDPLQGYSNPLASSDSLTSTRPDWDRYAWALALGVGVTLGGLVWLVRGVLSDNAMFAHAVEANASAPFRSYLARGSRHAAEVNAVLLPRALLHDAEQEGTVEAIERFLRDHPERAVAAEASAALRTALLRELDVASSAGTLAALDAFTRKHPRGPVEPELKAARHRVFSAALDRYVAGVADRGAPAAVFMQRLLAWTEQKGPSVELRFHRRRSKSLERADAAAGKSRQFKGAVSLPSRYFDDAAEKGDFLALAGAVQLRFRDAFPAELVSINVGEAIADPDAPLPPQVSTPTLFVDQATSWAGSMQVSSRPRGVFAGLELSFEGAFRLPDDTKALHVKTDGWHVADLSAARDAEAPEEVVYGGMRAKAFEQFQKRLLATLFPAAR